MLNKQKIIVGCICLALCIGGTVILINKTHKKSQEFNENVILEKTKVFLMERANLLSGDKSQLQITSTFYEPMEEERMKEMALRQDIYSYAKLIKDSGNMYTNPILTLNSLKRIKDEREKVVIKVKETIMYAIKGASTDTGFANEHIISYMKIKGEWKMVKDEVLGKNSMVSPAKEN